MELRSAILIFIFGVFLSTPNIIKFCLGSTVNISVCNERERKALLTFKQHLQDSSNQLSSWNGTDCCRWDGVVCNNNKTDPSVVQLNLHGFMLDGELNSSLLELKNLNHLDLSSNYFQGIPIPAFLGSFQNLRYLNLSGTSFRAVDDLQWLSHLSSLQYLDMTNADLSMASSNWLRSINMLPSLLELHLRYCNLQSLPTLSYLNFTSLKILDLSYNGFNSSLPEWFYNLTSLEQLDLRYNIFRGTVSEAIANLVSLTSLVFYANEFEGEIPRTLGNLCNLQILDLSDNKFSGEISGFLGNSSGCIANSLKYINLDSNQLSGPLPDQLGRLKNLEYLSLRANSFSGSIPSSLGRLSSLTVLELIFNKLNGSVPESFGNLSNLKIMRISYNALEGVVTEVHFANLTRLEELEMDSVVLKLSPNWVPPFRLQVATCRACQVGPQFPEWLHTQKNLTRVDLSNAGISGTVPTWFWNISSQFTYLNLSHNQIGGEVPDLLLKTDASAGAVYLRSNQFTGRLPRISPHVRELDLSSNSFSGPISVLLCNPMDKMNELAILDLSGNLLSGELPQCWSHWNSLELIRLGNNNLTGKIPSSMGSITGLRSLQLRNNSLSGELPSSLRNCIELRAIDLGENEFTGSIPKWIGESFRFLLVLGLRLNKFYGGIPRELCHLNSLQLLDLAHNNLSGSIPRCFSNFSAMATTEKLGDRIFYSVYADGDIVETALSVTKGREFEYTNILSLFTSMDLSNNSLSGVIPEELTSLLGLRSLNLSENYLTGKIPDKIGRISILESLDLSKNRLSGLIPQSLVDLTFLSHLNLSYNNLSGKIPSSTQLRGFTESSFLGNQRLCGPPLKNCNGDGQTQAFSDDDRTKEDEDDDWLEMKWFYISLALGLVIGLWGFCGALVVKKSWRLAYFGFLDYMIGKLCKCCSSFKTK